jgi:hypothetical protein
MTIAAPKLSISSFFSVLWETALADEKAVALPILVKAAEQIAANPTAINFIAQLTGAVADLERAQPGILQSELQQIAQLIQEATTSMIHVDAPPPPAPAAAAPELAPLPVEPPAAPAPAAPAAPPAAAQPAPAIRPSAGPPVRGATVVPTPRR